MTTISCRYDGGLRCAAEHEPSGSLISTDAPVDNAGKGERFSPTDLIATSLATCLLTVMGIVAERHGWSLEGASARVQKTMSSEPPRRIAALEVWLTLPASLEERQRRVLRRAAEGCPVKASLEGAIAMTMHWECSALHRAGPALAHGIGGGRCSSGGGHAEEDGGLQQQQGDPQG